MSDTTPFSCIWKNVPSISSWFQPEQTTESITEKESKKRRFLHLFTNTNLKKHSSFHWIQLKTTFSILNRYRLIIHENRCCTTAVRSMLSLIPPPSTTTTSCSTTSIITDAEDTNKLHTTSNLLSNCNKRMTDGSKTTTNDTNTSSSSPTKVTTPRTSNACTTTTTTTTTTVDASRNNSNSPMYLLLSPRSDHYYYPSQNKHHNTTSNISDTQTASRLAEGTIYSLRDLVLDEAIELNSALQFWTERWEKPLLSWLEAGPIVWFSKEGYNHKKIGQRVSQIQALLARRCASVGELQQHLWRAGWQRGVAQWGIIGEGWKWATVVGGNGWSFDNDILQPVVGGIDDTTRFFNQSSHIEEEPDPMLLNHSNSDISSAALQRSASHGTTTEIVSNEPALAEWTIDAIRMVRAQLLQEQQGDGHPTLPQHENWHRESIDGEYLPVWALDVEKQFPSNTAEQKSDEPKVLRRQSSKPTKMTISNLPLMAAEIKDLLTVMESQAAEQREYRSRTICPPSKLSRNWYVVCGSLPVVSYVSYKVLKDGWGARLCKQIFVNIKEFYVEHVAEPVTYVYTQIFSSRVGVEISAADQKARLQAIESLKKMLQDWVDQTFPNMSSRERRQIAETMDMSLIEKKKEESVKNALYEISDIVRMSLIEMQFVKKELMNAMVSMDELMQSNEFNFKLAAMTPAFILVYGVNRLFRYLFYSLLSLGRSREQVHESVRLAVLDIERLLVMRDRPPSVPPLQGSVAKYRSTTPTYSLSDVLGTFDEVDYGRHHALAADRERQENVLNSVDLGMLLLLVHECRTTMLKNSRRFTQREIRSFSEDLAELSGERGPVSVNQQLSIISRMFRTYSFLKVVSSGVTFNVTRYNL